MRRRQAPWDSATACFDALTYTPVRAFQVGFTASLVVNATMADAPEAAAHRSWLVRTPAEARRLPAARRVGAV